MPSEALTKLDGLMTASVNNLQGELAKVRTGRATPALLDGVKVDYYGSMMPISQVSTVTAPEARTLQIQPWEASMLQPIEKALLVSDLGLVPQNDGKVIRVPLPALTEERRKDLVKFVKKLGEDCKIALRGERRDANDEIKKAEKDKSLSADEAKKETDSVQKKTDDFVAKVDKLVSDKEKEIMSV